MRWFVQTKKADFYGIGAKLNIDPVLVRIMRNRDIIEENDYKDFMDCNIEKLSSPLEMKDMDKAIAIIRESMRNHEKIRVIGDYDIDGVTSGYILCDGLEKMGADVDFDVPDRILDGYGLNQRLVEQAKEDKVDLIVTCDNGIAAFDSIAYGKSVGMKIVVTDHHEVKYETIDGEKKYLIPEADAVVDAKQEDCPYPFKELCGAGVAYQLIRELSKYYISDKEQREDFLRDYLAFAGIGTIGDIVPLLSENRTIAKNGLREVNHTRNIGLRALIQANNLQGKEIKSYHIGFVIGPCINASGRLETAFKAFSLFREKDAARAELLARELTDLNEERKQMTEDYVAEAFRIIDGDEYYQNSSCLVVYLSGCHESLAGIIAGRIRQKYYKPVICLTDGEEMLKGSARSIEGYDLNDELIKVNQKYKETYGEDLIAKFGGHKMAAGLSIEQEKLQVFRDRLNEAHSLDEEIYDEKIMIDVPMPFSYITRDLIGQFDKLEPFGAQNPKPIFAEKCPIIESVIVRGANRNVLSMKLVNEDGYRITATMFMNSEVFFEDIEKKYGKGELEKLLKRQKNKIAMKILYYPVINDYTGNIEVVINNYVWYN